MSIGECLLESKFGYKKGINDKIFRYAVYLR